MSIAFSIALKSISDTNEHYRRYNCQALAKYNRKVFSIIFALANISGNIKFPETTQAYRSYRGHIVL